MEKVGFAIVESIIIGRFNRIYFTNRNMEKAIRDARFETFRGWLRAAGFPKAKLTLAEFQGVYLVSARVARGCERARFN